MRIEQKRGTRGSQKWLQVCVNRYPELLDVPAMGPVEWKSPLGDDSYAEYRDAAFLKRLGLERLSDALAAFWPARGPQWDALGVNGNKFVLVEAKAHLAEMKSSCAAGPKSRQQIEKAFKQVCDDLGFADPARWVDDYYQLANRIAHLWFLRQHGVDAHLLLIGFINDEEMRGPKKPEEWRSEYKRVESVLGISPGHALSAYIHHVFPDVRNLDDMSETSTNDWRTPEQRANDMAQAKALRKQASEGGLRFEAYLPSGLAEWILDLVERGDFVDPSEAVFVIVGIYRDLEPHTDLRQEILRCSLEAAMDDPRPGILAEDVFKQLKKEMRRKRPEPAQWLKQKYE